MSTAADSALPQLLDELEAALASERNQARLQRPPGPMLAVGLEDPIAWVRLFGFDAQRYFADARFNLEQQLRHKLWRFWNLEDDTPLDNVVPAWLGHYPEYTFFGMTVEVRCHGGPDIQTDHPLTRTPDVSLLPEVDFHTSGWMPRMLRWYEDLCELSAGRLQIPFFAWNRGCLDLAVQLRGYETFLMDTVERPDFVHELMARLVRERCRWYVAAAEYLGTGLGPTFIADDWVSVPYISPGIFHDFVMPYYLELEAFHGAVSGFHSCGDQAPLHADMLRIKSLNTFEISPWMDPAQALANLPPDKHLNVKAHPNDVVVDPPAEMARKHRAKAALLRASGRRYDLATSGLTPLHDESEFVGRINTWLRLAREAYGLG